MRAEKRDTKQALTRSYGFAFFTRPAVCLMVPFHL